jgi:hypothetical protein
MELSSGFQKKAKLQRDRQIVCDPMKSTLCLSAETVLAGCDFGEEERRIGHPTRASRIRDAFLAECRSFGMLI